MSKKTFRNWFISTSLLIAIPSSLAAVSCNDKTNYEDESTHAKAVEKSINSYLGSIIFKEYKLAKLNNLVGSYVNKWILKNENLNTAINVDANKFGLTKLDFSADLTDDETRKEYKIFKIGDSGYGLKIDSVVDVQHPEEKTLIVKEGKIADSFTQNNDIDFKGRQEFKWILTKFNETEKTWEEVDKDSSGLRSVILSHTRDYEGQLTNPSSFETKIDFTNAKKLGIEWNTIRPDIFYDAEVLNISDGDTTTVKINDARLANDNKKLTGSDGKTYESQYENGATVKVRLAGIDTPEKAVDSEQASVFEKQYAQMSSSFNESNFKKGDKVRIFMTSKGSGKDSFGRVTADVFFGEEYQYSYNVEIVRKGLTLPYVKKTDVGANINKNSPYHYILLPMRDAFMEAMTSREGFYKNFSSAHAVSNNVYRIKPNTDYQYIGAKNSFAPSELNTVDSIIKDLHKPKNN
ncbi:thermonuclease family protein [Mycoplasmopsis opalescens]|uniref:thermonuclease family protein n=1 Tax=Mycoplasmopsis opalescens TaxID=114886 RepID=UPI0004A72890|nr:thermonuclease family protein [Mycoplasmopsis opalescens]